MGKGRRNKKKEIINGDTASNEGGTANASPSNTIEVKMDEQKIERGSESSTDLKAGVHNMFDDATEICQKNPDIAAEYLHVLLQSLKECTKDVKNVEISRDNIQDFQSDKENLTATQENKDSRKKDNEYKDIPLKKDDHFKRKIKIFITCQNFKLNEQVKIMNGMVSELPKQQDHFSSEIKAIKPESHEETRHAKDFTNEVYEQDLADYHERTKQLEKNDGIYFEFKADGSNRIEAGEKYCCLNGSLLKENEGMTFEYKNENIQVSFVSNQIIVSTENSEFNISFRYDNPILLADEATQTKSVQ